MRSDLSAARRRGVVALAAAAFVCTSAAAQQRGLVHRTFLAGSVTSAFRAEPNVSVEMAGLRQWTVGAVESKATAAGLTIFPGIYETSTLTGVAPQSVVFQSPGDSLVSVFVAVVEPADAPRFVTVRKIPPLAPAAAKARKQPAWLAIGPLANAPFKVLRRGILDRLHRRAVGLAPALSPSTMADSADLTQVWTTLDAHQSSEDAADARKVLLSSPSVDDRIAAIAVLSNFDRDDVAWHALAGALLDPKEQVRAYARDVLGAFATDLPRPVDWRPAAPTLHALLQGSDLRSLRDVMLMLVATGAGPEVAAPLLKNGGHAVLLFAGARHWWAREPAQRFLRTVSGRDLTTPAEWRRWMAGL